MDKYVKVIEVRFIEVEDGDYVDPETSEDHVDCDPDEYDLEDGLTAAMKAAEVIRDWGCTENAGHWFSDPDGSYIADYATGEQVETSCHLHGFTDEEFAAIAALVKAV